MSVWRFFFCEYKNSISSLSVVLFCKNFPFINLVWAKDVAASVLVPCRVTNTLNDWRTNFAPQDLPAETRPQLLFTNEKKNNIYWSLFFSLLFAVAVSHFFRSCWPFLSAPFSLRSFIHSLFFLSLQKLITLIPMKPDCKGMSYK